MRAVGLFVVVSMFMSLSVAMADETTKSPATQILPNFVGMPLAKAMEAARRQLLIPEVYSMPQPTADPKLDGLVANQNPAAGVQVLNSRRVVLTPYKYSPAVTDAVVPNVVGLTLDKATATLTKQGFQVHRSERTFIFDKAKAEIVYSQSPAPGEKLARGQFVCLSNYEYHEKEVATVPNVVGLTTQEARNVLKKSGFTLVNSIDGQPQDRVISQRPAAGQAYSTFEIVLLYSRAARTHQVPQLIDMPIADAVKKVRQLGLDPTPEAVDSYARPGAPRLGGGAPPVRRGIVLEQRPQPGEMLADREAVYLIYIPLTK